MTSPVARNIREASTPRETSVRLAWGNAGVSARMAYLLVATTAVFLAFSHWGYDDPYITYRYADNLKQGLGFVYNPGERLLSTTTPFFALLLAFLGSLWSDLPLLANFVSSLGMAVGALFLYELARTWKAPLVAWGSLVLYPTFPLVLGTIGSETPLYLGFCIGAFAFYARRRYTLTALSLALAILTRADAAVVAVILALDYLVRVRRPVPWLAISLFLGLTLSWFAFAWAYFGSPLPVTLVAKQQQGVMTISEGFAPGLVTMARGYAGRWPYPLEGVLVLVGIGAAVRWFRPWLLFLAWPLLYYLAYTVLGVPRYPWYYAPLVPGFLAGVALGLSSLLAVVRRIRARADGQWLQVIGGVVLLLLAFGQMEHLMEFRQIPDPRLGIYRDVGEWLQVHTPEGASVGTLEVGIIGYYARRPIVDFAGLIQPAVADRFGPHTTYQDSALWAVAQYQPDYLVLQDGVFPQLEQGYVREHCRSLRHFEGEPYNYPGTLRVYACE